jgi:hypothetical protein
MIRRTYARHAHAQPRRRNLRAVQKVRAQEPNRDEEVERKHEESTGSLCRFIAFWVGRGNG